MKKTQKKGLKMTKDVIDKLVKTINYLIAPVTAVFAIWNLDVGVYVAAAAGMFASILSFVKLFVKD